MKGMTGLIRQDGFALWAFMALFALAYLWGVVSIQHYLPSAELYQAFFVALMLSLAGCIFFKRYPIRRITTSSVLWLALLLLMVLQPVLHQVVYVDNLLWPTSILLLCGMMALALNQLDAAQKAWATHFMAWAMLWAGVLNVLTQWGQLLRLDSLVGVLLFQYSDRVTGNIAQVNQSAFVSSMALAACVYFIYYYQQRCNCTVRTWAVFTLLAFWLSLGIGFTASRGGLILAVAAVFIAALFFQASLRQRVVLSLVFLPILIAGYTIGTKTMNALMQTQLSAVGRIINEGSLHLRTGQIEQGWWAFQERWLFGHGYDSMISFALENAERVNWFSPTQHLHNIVVQMAAEFGLIGLLILLGFVIILIKNLRFNLSADKAFCYAILSIIGLYSLSEYPLWYLKFLMLAVFFIAMIDERSFVLKRNIQKIFMVLSVLFVIGSVYYITAYQDYRRFAYSIRSDTIQDAVFTPPDYVFGFGKYHEMMLYLILPVREDNVHEQLALGERVNHQFLADFMLVKQADMLALVGEETQADIYYRKACLFGFSATCSENVIAPLQEKAATYPDVYAPYLQRFSIWYQQQFDRPLPKVVE